MEIQPDRRGAAHSEELTGRPSSGIAFAHPGAFWLGAAACTAGVLLHLPMYLGAARMNYRMVGMHPDTPMLAGMVLIVVGLLATAYGLIPRRPQGGTTTRIRVSALDDAPIRPAHVGLLIMMALAVTIDVMKPTALSFVLPGATVEYGLKSGLTPHGHVPAALLPLAGISGTVIGSFAWGWLSDRIGRRPSILLAGMLFATTAICGAMPGFTWNLLMCFLMGLGAGGMLPITFTLLAETIPVRHRGWLMVLIGGNIAVAYFITSWLSAELVPHYSWRILWLMQMPTGLLLIALNRWIPESARFLLAEGRAEEARGVLDRYGATTLPVTTLPVTTPGTDAPPRTAHRYALLFSRPYIGHTGALLLLGLGVGLMTYGFLLWIPTNLQHLGFTEETTDKMLRDTSLIGFLLTIPVALGYGFWSSKKTISGLGALTAAALFGFVAAGDSIARSPGLLHVLLVVPVWSISSMTAVLAAYSTEIYPTRVRSRGAGLSAGASKAGGVLVIGLVAAAIATPSITITALLGAVPIALAVLAIALVGVETRRRSLEEITPRLPGETTPCHRQEVP
ncbi:MAG: MFS transporter [Pseudonocardiaceae bacterium]